MSELSKQGQPELGLVLTGSNPLPHVDPTASFLKLARSREGNQELQLVLGQSDMPRAAEDAYWKYAEQTEVPVQFRAAAAIGQLLIGTNGGSLLDPDEETWHHIANDTQFNEARLKFSGMTHRNADFENLRHEMTSRILAIFCQRTEQYLGWPEQENLPLKNTA